MEEARKCKAGGAAAAAEEGEEEEWINRLKHGGALPYRELHKCTHGWSSPHGNLFQVRSSSYMESKRKTCGGEPLLKPIAFDWIQSSTKIFNILKHPHGRVRAALQEQEQEQEQSIRRNKSPPFIWAINLQVPSKHNHSLVFYYVAPSSSSCCQSSHDKNGHTLLQRFLDDDDDDSFRNSRFKLLANVVQGPWLVKAAVGERGACLLGKAVTCHYTRDRDFMEIDVDIGASIVANAIVHLAFASVTCLTVDLAFVLEGQSPEELPERILGTIRFANLDPASATSLDSPPLNASPHPRQMCWSSFGSLLHSAHQDPVANVDDEDSHPCQAHGYGHGHGHAGGGANALS